MKKVLILTDSVSPPLNAPRMRNLYNNLCKKDYGWQPFLIADFADNAQIYTLFEKPENVYQLKISSSKNVIIWLFQFFVNLFFKPTERKMLKKALQLSENRHFDLILCSVSNIFPMYAAAKLSEKLNIPLVFDFRDINEQWAQQEFNTHSFNFLGLGKPANKIYGKLIVFQRNRLINSAVHITTVSRWHTDFFQKFGKKVSLIYNGFDQTEFFPQVIKNHKFTIVYAGRLSASRVENLHTFFKTLNSMINSRQIDAEKIEIQWYIPENEYVAIDTMTEKYALKHCNRHCAVVANNEIANVLNSSSILLILTSKTSKGVLTTKFFEYAGVEKPVLCIMSDEGELERTIYETNAGLSARNQREIRDFIMAQYQIWQNQGYTQAPVNKEVKARFSRQQQAKQFVDIFNKIVKQ
ncbi:MAG: glycosyltransferase [Prevotellaceae bacterium]|jgi:glycosyltransferase involved in cell wall biosynthesis|nr:glycosyltransferase [Prevotellaceae bacterium]